MTGLPLFPVVSVEFVGSALAILLSCIALGYARALSRLQPNNFIWGFLFYFCIVMAAFSLSRGVGHIVRIILVYDGRNDIWKQISPYSGGFNTLLMISVAAVTIYYYKGLAAYKAVGSEAKKLADANARLATSAQQLQQLNANLEEIVEVRTRNLSDSEKKFRNFFENSKDIIYFCNLNGDITNINSRGVHLLGFESAEEIGNFHKLFNDTEVLRTFLCQLRDKGFVSDLDMACRGKDGITRHILLSANAIYSQDGEIVGYEGIGKDMTRLHTITEQLINHEKMASVGQMAAGVAHEINTPLGIILGYAQLMMDDYPKESEIHGNLQVIERQTKACRRIVTDLLKFSRQSESIKTHIDMNTLIEEVLSVSEHTLNINKITIDRRFAANLPTIIGDAEKLRQVFMNLLTNSQDAMPDGGNLNITTTRVEQELQVTVEDDGSGIAEGIKKNIFDPFFTTKAVGKGTGLGLSVTYGIIQEHHGTITVESPVARSKARQTNPGTAFCIHFPIADEHLPKEEEIC